MALRLLSALVLSLVATASLAHDTWVQTNTNVIRSNDSVYIDLMLGNHGNEHRDFKLAGKIDLAKCTLDVVGPDGKSFDLKPNVVDRGYAPREGYWSAKFVPVASGLYCAAHKLDTLHKTTRAIKSAKTYFVVSENLDKVTENNPGFDKPLGHPFELVPTVNPVTPMGPEKPIGVKLLYQGKPLAGARVTFIPRGVELSQSFDDRYERQTDDEGRAQFTPTEGNYYLVVAHHSEPDQRGDNFDRTSYSATLTVLVPDLCPCCD